MTRIILRHLVGARTTSPPRWVSVAIHTLPPIFDTIGVYPRGQASKQAPPLCHWHLHVPQWLHVVWLHTPISLSSPLKNLPLLSTIVHTHKKRQTKIPTPHLTNSTPAYIFIHTHISISTSPFPFQREREREKANLTTPIPSPFAYSHSLSSLNSTHQDIIIIREVVEAT